MSRLYAAGLETLAAALILVPLLLCFQKHWFPSRKRAAVCSIFCLYLAAVYALAGLPHILYIRFQPHVNLEPFAYMFSDWDATLLNVLLFVPLGIFLPLLWKQFDYFWKTALAGFLFSSLIETMQLFTYRATDVNDLMTNTLGTCLGFLLARTVLHFYPQLPSHSKKELPRLCGATFAVLFFLQPFLSRLLRSFLM